RRAEPGTDLFVGGGAEDQIAGGLESFTRQRRDRDRFRGDLSLHVERAATPDLTVAQLTAERIGAPLRGVGEHDVRVREEEKRRAVAASGNTCDQVRALGNLRVQLALHAALLEVVAQELRGGRLVARGVRRV